ncbi:MAG: DNA translocase FtsK 4TM domain-containing protein, partial [Roseovarius gahaiensis]
MAYQTRGRDPLLDSTMAEAIEKRGKELLGLALLLLGAMAAAMIASYHPDDPSWMSATDAPVQNWMGRLGASIASPLFMIVGWGAWGLAIVLGAWGLRLALHRGEDRAVGRLIFAPIWVALLSLYASSLTPGETWAATHSFGLGGLFGDTVLGTLLGILPMGASFGLKLLSIVLGLGVFALGAFVLGFTRSELLRTGRFLLVGLIMTYAWIMALMGRGAKGAFGAAHVMQAKVSETRARRAADRAEAEEVTRAEATVPAQPVVQRSAAVAEPQVSATAHVASAAPEQAEKPGALRMIMPSLMRRPEPEPEPELVESYGPEGDVEAPGDDRIRAKITEVIKNRVRQNPAIRVESVAPLTKGRGRGPDPLILNTSPPRAADLPAEPPLTAAQAPTMSQEPPLTAAEPSQPMRPEAQPVHAYQPQPEQPEMQVPPQPAPAQPRIPVAEPKKVVQHTPRKASQPSSRAMAEAQPALQFEDSMQTEYELPPLSLLNNPANIVRHHLSDDALEENARMLENVLDDYGVKGEIVSVRPGPVVTMYELEPAPGLKASRVIGLADDIARSMSALSARVSTVPGRSVIGIELPNDNREMVSFREILSSRDYGDGNQKLPLALGKDIGGDPVVQNLAKMPHLLIAGTTGSGKSVAINTMILSLLYKLTPDECRLIMIDPKMLELSVYDGIPHLLSPVVTDPKKAVVALKWVVAEMEERYRKMSKMGVRNIDGYNGRVADALSKGEMFSRTVQTGFDDETGEPVF